MKYIWIGIGLIILSLFTNNSYGPPSTATVLFFTIGFFMLFVPLFLKMAKKGGAKMKAKKQDKQEFENDRLNNVIDSLEDFAVDEIFTSKDKTAFIAVDESNRKFALGGILEGSGEMTSKVIFAKDILGVDLVEDGKGLLSGSSSRNVLGSAAIGGLLFGEAGAIVGAVAGSNSDSRATSIALKLAIDDIKTPYIGMNFLTSSTSKNSTKYKEAKQTAEKWVGIVSILLEREKRQV